MINKKSKKASIIIDLTSMRNPYTGLSVYCEDLVNSLYNQNISKQFKVQLFCPKNSTNLFSKKFPIRVIKKLHKIFIPRKNQYSLWHTTYQLSKHFPTLYTGKILLTIHDLNFLHESIEDITREKFFKSIESRIARADKIVAISQFVKDDILKNYSIDASKIQVIYRSISNDEKILKLPDYIPQSKFFFTVGPIEDKKNFKVLPAMLLDNDYELIIAGKITDVNYKMSILNYAKELHVENRLHILGPIEDEHRNWYLKNCVLMPFPSKAEGFGLPVIEAMYFGTPVILSRYTSLPEIGGDVAFYFDDYNPESIKRKTLDVLTEINTNPDLSRLLKDRAKFFYELDSATQYKKLYNEMLV